jgi:hypothetical protein
MINSRTEEILSLTEAAKRLPIRRGGKRPHVSCLYRWTVTGCRGVVLESIAIGGTRCTSAEALQRFFDRLSSKSQTPVEPAPAGRTHAQRSRANERAARELERLGV